MIFPGVEISLEALTERAAALPTIDLTAPRDVLGKSTVDAIRSGVLYGYAGMVDGILERLRGRARRRAHAIATGGLAGAVVPYCEPHRRGRRPADAHGPAAHLGARTVEQRRASSAIDVNTRRRPRSSAGGVSAA